MRKTLAFAAASLISLCAFGQAEEKAARIDIDQVQSPQAAELVPGSAEGGAVGNATWFKTEEERGRIVSASFPAAAEWRKGSFSFTPSKDCARLSLVLLSQGEGGPQILFDDVKIEGASIVNGDFESGLDGWWLNTAKDGSKASAASGAHSGSYAAKVTESHRIAQAFPAKAGVPITVSFWFKLSE